MANLDDRKKELSSLVTKAQEAIDKGDLETARNLKADIDAQKKEYEELEQLSQEIESSAPKQEEVTQKDEGAEETDNKAAEEKEGTSVDDAKGEEKSDDKPSNDDKPSSEEKPEPPAIEKVEEPTEEELEEEKDKKKKEGAKRSMAKLNQNQETNEEILGFEQYMKSKGAKRDNVKSDDAGVTIPHDIKYIPEKEVNTVQDLSQLVQKEKVNGPSGEYPILKRANAKFSTVAELEANPELAKPEFKSMESTNLSWVYSNLTRSIRRFSC